MYESLLKNIRNKSSISEEEFREFKLLLRPATIQKNDFFIRTNNKAQDLAYIVSGALYSYSVDEKGSKHVVQIALKDNWISDPYSFLSNQPAIYDVQAIEKTEVILISLRFNSSRLASIYYLVTRCHKIVTMFTRVIM